MAGVLLQNLFDSQLRIFVLALYFAAMLALGLCVQKEKDENEKEMPRTLCTMRVTAAVLLFGFVFMTANDGYALEMQYQTGTDALDRGDWVKAATEFDKALQSSPDHSLSLMGKSLAHLREWQTNTKQLRELDLAISSMERAREDFSFDPYIYHSLAWLHWFRAGTLFEIIKKTPHQNDLGDTEILTKFSFEKGEPHLKKAREYISRAIQLDPSNRIANHVRAQEWISSQFVGARSPGARWAGEFGTWQKFPGAESDRDSDDPMKVIAWARNKRFSGESKSAIPKMNHLIQIGFRNANQARWALAELIRLNMRAGDLDQARELLIRLKKLNRDQRSPHFGAILLWTRRVPPRDDQISGLETAAVPIRLPADLLVAEQQKLGRPLN